MAPNNRVMVLEMNEDNLSITKLCEIEEYYPCTKIQWIPLNQEYQDDVFATSSDILRIYRPCIENGDKLEKLVELKNNSEYSGPLTSFNWNPDNLHQIATSSIDNTVTVWDINSQTVVT
jgi:WD repeat-containing protein 68